MLCTDRVQYYRFYLTAARVTTGREGGPIEREARGREAGTEGRREEGR